MITYVDPSAFLDPPKCKCGKPLRECLREPCDIMVDTIAKELKLNIEQEIFNAPNNSHNLSSREGSHRA